MSRFDQAKMLMKVRKLQKELQKEVIVAEAGDGAVKVEITGEQKLKRVHIDPEFINLADIGQLERWIEQAVKEAIAESQKLAAEKMQPMMGQLGDLGLQICMAKGALKKQIEDDVLGSKLVLTAYRTMRFVEKSVESFGLTYHTYLVLYFADQIP